MSKITRRILIFKKLNKSKHNEFLSVKYVTIVEKI